MKTNTSLTWIIFCLIFISSCASTKQTQKPVPIPDQTEKSKTTGTMTETDKYISTYKFLAIREMQRAKIPASITLAQGILESSVGQSYLARKANNHFGIKCKSNWTGPSITYDDDSANECFKSYSSVDQSFIDHSDHLANNPRYAKLFTLDITDYKGWATGLKAAGYATRSNYAELLIGIIERYQLNELDKFQTNKTNGTEKSAQFVYNGLPAVMVREGDTYKSILRDNDITMEKLVKYNDLEPDQPLHQDMILYLKSKKSKGKESYHIVKEGETMYSISQDYAIKLDNLLDMNLMVSYENPAEGEIIYLKQKRSDPPSLLKKGAVDENVKKEEPPVTVYTNNQQKSIEQSNDFVMTKKDTSQAVIHDTLKAPVAANTSNRPVLTNTNVQPNVPANTIDSAKIKENVVVKNNLQTLPPATIPKTGTAASVNPATPVVKPLVTTSNTTDYHIVQKGESMFSISKLYGMTVIDLQNLNGMTDYAIKIGQRLLVNKNLTSNVSSQPVVPSATVKTTTAPKTNVAPVVTNKPVAPVKPASVTSPITPIDTSKKLKDSIYHVVQQGETFYSISREYKVKISDIIEWNNIKEYKLNIGQKIVVGAPQSTGTSTSARSSVSQSSMNNTIIVPFPTRTTTTKTEGKYHIVQPKQTLFSISKMYNTTVEKLMEWNSLPDNSISIGQKLRVKP
jgi:LysM repeat protein